MNDRKSPAEAEKLGARLLWLTMPVPPMVGAFPLSANLYRVPLAFAPPA
jgi:hypothetical protein